MNINAASHVQELIFLKSLRVIAIMRLFAFSEDKLYLNAVIKWITECLDVIYIFICDVRQRTASHAKPIM